MIIRLQLFFISLTSGLLFLFILCLGAQNRNDRIKTNLIFATTAPLPKGFVVGASIITGVISGGSASALILPSSREND